MALDLSERQRATVAAAITILAGLVILCAVGGLFWLVGIFLRRFSHVFLPLAVAAVAAFVFNPYYTWLRERLRLPRAAAVAAVFLSALLPLAAFLWFFGALLAEQASDFIAKLPEWWRGFVDQVQERWPRFVEFLDEHPLGQRLRSAVEEQQQVLVEGIQRVGGKALSAGAVALRGVGTILSWAVLPVYFAFFLMTDPRRFQKLEQQLPFLKAETRKDLVYLVKEFVGIIVAFFRGQLIVAFLQGLLYAVGFSLVGLRYGFVLGLVLGFLNIIPYLGTIVGLGLTLPLAFFQQGGGVWIAGWVLVVYIVVQLIESYVLTPRIMGDRTGLHPMAIIVAVFFWGSALGGILGMILAIPLTAFLVVFWRLAKEKYIQELV